MNLKKFFKKIFKAEDAHAEDTGALPSLDERASMVIQIIDRRGELEKNSDDAYDLYQAAKDLEDAALAFSTELNRLADECGYRESRKTELKKAEETEKSDDTF